MTELREKINDIILSYCEGHYHLEFTEDDLPNILNEIEEAINYNQCCTELPIKELPNCNRVEVIDQKGRSYVNWQPNNKVRLSMQDDGRTAKIFID